MKQSPKRRDQTSSAEGTIDWVRGMCWLAAAAIFAMQCSMALADGDIAPVLWVLPLITLSIGVLLIFAFRSTKRQVATPETRELAASVARIYEDKTCGICGKPFEVGGPFVECPDCRQWYHEECWERLGGCVTDGCPSAPSKVARRARVAQPGVPAQPVAVARAIHNVGFCPYCQTPVQAGSDYVTCPACKTPYHPDCWQENGGCAVYGCNVRISG